MIQTNDILERSFDETETARCTFDITEKGLVFADPDHAYLCLTGKTIEDLGKTSADIFGGTEHDHAEKLHALCRILGGSASLPKLYHCGVIRKDTASVCGSDLLISSAQPDGSWDLGSGRRENNVGTIIAAEKGDILYAEHFSRKLSGLFGSIRTIPDVSRFLVRNIENISPDEVLHSVIESCRPADLCSVCSPVSKKGRRAVHISAVPLGDRRLAISFYTPLNAGGPYNMALVTASGTETVTGGTPVLCGMTAYLGAMLERREITLPFILSSAETVRETGRRMSFVYGGKDGVTMFAAPITNDPERIGFTVCENDEALVGYGLNLPQLTKREYIVLYHAAKGRSTPAIAERLGIADATVSKLLYHSYKKLNIASRTDAVRLF